MPALQEQTPEERRFERIEKAHEFLTGIVAGVAVTQQKIEESQLRTEFTLTQLGEQMRKLAEAQTTAGERIANLADVQAKHAGEHDGLKEKLHILYDVVDNWIRAHGGAGKTGNPAPETPPG